MNSSHSIQLFHSTSGDLAAIWQRLEDVARENISRGVIRYMDFSFYQTLGWNRFLEECYAGSKVRRLDYIVVSDADGPVAIIPLLANRLSHKIEIVSGKIAGILNAVCPFAGPRVIDAMKAAVRYMASRYAGWKWKFLDMPRHSPFFEVLVSCGVAFSERGSYHIPMSDFASHDEYVKSLGRNIYKNIRKAYNHLSTDGRQWSVNIYDSTRRPDATVRKKVWTLYFLRRLAWQRRSQTLPNKLICAFRGRKEALSGKKSKSMERLDESMLITLEIDGRLAVFMHIYIHGRFVLMPKLAIDASFSRYSPGIILVLETLKLLRERGVEDFDMCRGDERYKMEVGGVKELLGGVIIKKATESMWS